MGFEFWVLGSEFRILSPGFWVSDVGFTSEVGVAEQRAGEGGRTWFRVKGSCIMVHGSWFMVHGAWFMVHDSWFRV